jgi:FkbM family methyltransferase
MKQKIIRILHIFIKKFYLENLIIFISNILNLKTWKTLPQNIYYEDSDCTKITKDKVIFNVNRSDFTQWQIYANYPEMHFEAFKKTKKGNVIDVGANIGSFSLKVGKYFNDNKINSKVYAFEPYKKIFKLLKKNLDLNINLRENTVLINQAIGGYDNENFLINIVKNNLGANNLKKLKKNLFKNNSRIASSITLDTYVLKKKITNIAFIKIDVEGMELDVLDGAKQILKNFTPSIFIEINEKLYNKNNTSVIKYIDKFKKDGKKFYIENQKFNSKLVLINYTNLIKLIENNNQSFNLFVN